MADVLEEALRLVLAYVQVDLAAWAVGWARLLPSVLLIPALGLRALPAPARALFAVAMAAAIAPAVRPVTTSGPLLWVLPTQVLIGLPVALSAAALLWAATMAGGLVDNLRGGSETSPLPIVEPGATPIGALLALLVSIGFLQFGGASSVAAALSQTPSTLIDPIASAAMNLVAAIQLALAVAAPLLAVSILVEVAGALIARAANPAHIQVLIAPLRSVALLAAAGLLLEKMAALLVEYAASHLPT